MTEFFFKEKKIKHDDSINSSEVNKPITNIANLEYKRESNNYCNLNNNNEESQKAKLNIISASSNKSSIKRTRADIKIEDQEDYFLLFKTEKKEFINK